MGFIIGELLGIVGTPYPLLTDRIPKYGLIGGMNIGPPGPIMGVAEPRLCCCPLPLGRESCVPGGWVRGAAEPRLRTPLL